MYEKLLENDENNIMDENTGVNIHWTSQLERVISDEGERALCFSWLHSHAEKRYSRLNTGISLPVIVMSTLAGSASFGAGVIFPSPASANVTIGAISIIVGVMNTVAGFFSWAKRAESHRLCALTYQKVYRFILIELALPRSERISAKDMLKIVRDQSDRLQEMSPQIPDSIIHQFKVKFGETTPDVKKPEITNGLDPIFVYSDKLSTPPTRSPVHEIATPIRTHTTMSPSARQALVATLPPLNVPFKTSNDDHTPDK
jgi:hypothetical protein